MQGYCQAKTSQPDLMRPNAAVPSFTPVPSRSKWKQALPWHPGCLLGIMLAYYLCKMQFHLVFSWIYIPKDECLFQPGFELTSKHIITAAWENFLFSFFSTWKFPLQVLATTLWCQSFKAYEVKHLKPISNIKELGSCRQLGALSAAGLQLAAQHFSGSNECAPPRLAERRTMDIFPMTRVACALK